MFILLIKKYEILCQPCQDAILQLKPKLAFEGRYQTCYVNSCFLGTKYDVDQSDITIISLS